MPYPVAGLDQRRRSTRRAVRRAVRRATRRDPNMVSSSVDGGDWMLDLQLVLGLDALQTCIKMLPISITMFLAAAAGSRLSTRFTVRMM
jgi:hypothetical protein